MSAPGRPPAKDSDFADEDTQTVTTGGVPEEDDDEDTAEHDTGEYLMAVDDGSGTEDWANWDPDDAEGGWFKYFMIEAAQQQGDAALARRRLNEYGLRDEAQWAVVRTTFVKRHGQDSQAMARALARQKQQMGP